MDQWYILRNQQQYGPYTGKTLIQMVTQGQIFQGDMFAKAGGDRWLSYEQASPLWVTVMPKKKAKKKHGCLISILVFLLITSGLITFFMVTKKSDNIKLGNRKSETEATIVTNGGSIRIENSDSPINGLILDVPANAYSNNKKFKISTCEIKSHTFGGKFKPISPMITIDNGHEFSKEPMTLKIPISTTPDKFVMGFYYNEKTGKLEGIPFTELTNDHITLLTCHFSDIVLAETNRAELQQINVDTGFMPGVDDWQFVNRGSWIVPNGHCAGQTISMVWYFTEKYLGAGERRLYGRFDNNTYGYGTIDFWQDDSLSYRFASVVQFKLDWDSLSRKFINKYININNINTFCAFAFSMQMTGEPQYLSIRGDYTNSEGNVQNVGHAIAVYKIEQGRMYVSDPNYPGINLRSIRFNGNSFAPYSSGTDADAIAASGEISFNQMFYMAKTAFIDYETVSGLYEKIANKTIGSDDGQFPDYTIERLIRYNPTTGEKTWEEVKDEYKLSTEDTTAVDSSLTGKVIFRVKNTYSNMVSRLYMGMNPSVPKTSKNIHSATGNWEYTVELEKGVNHVGFLTEYQTAEGSNEYNDFHRIQILYDQQTEMEFEKQPYQAIIDTKLKYTATVKDVPSNTVYRWDFGDGTEIAETKKPTAEHIYEEAGDYEITLSLISTKDETLLAEASADVTVIDLYGIWSLNYTIEDAGGIDYILNMFIKALVGWLSEIFGTIPDEEVNVTLKGTVIGCVMTVIPPTVKGGDIRIELQQQTSSTEFVEPSEEIWYGKLTVNGDKIRISINSKEQATGIVFEGTVDPSGITGNFNAVIMSGSFEAKHN
ncbi:MAG: hypothetical protein K0S55_60 [Clostridia bacterium]|nr:hypothetical protein [Clostridia bacterium]